MYTYAGDVSADDDNGDGVGDVWWTAAYPAYDATVLNDGTLGSYVADASGMSLYIFLNDTPAADGYDPVSACNGGCVGSWPLFDVVDGVFPSGIAGADVDRYMRADGDYQATFRGWPLYYYAADSSPGDINGQGAVWQVVDPISD